MPSVQITMLKLLMLTKMVISATSVIREFLGGFMRDFISMGLQVQRSVSIVNDRDAFLTSCHTSLIVTCHRRWFRSWFWKCQVFCFESDEYERHFMPYHPEYSIITNIDFDHPDYFTSLKTSSTPSMIMLNKLLKACSFYGEDAELRKIDSKCPNLLLRFWNRR